MVFILPIISTAPSTSHHEVHNTNPAAPNVYYTTITLAVLEYKTMQNLHEPRCTFLATNKYMLVSLPYNHSRQTIANPWLISSTVPRCLKAWIIKVAPVSPLSSEFVSRSEWTAPSRPSWSPFLGSLCAEEGYRIAIPSFVERKGFGLGSCKFDLPPYKKSKPGAKALRKDRQATSNNSPQNV